MAQEARNLGLDLVKPIGRIVAAYDDGKGLSAALIANLLHVLNRELHADFDAEEDNDRVREEHMPVAPSRQAVLARDLLPPLRYPW